ncbi:hypothetical protein GE061_018811 [Apolygus lucorum]|uniref:Uncharacterized protein n=1 Tax=Apolygus lucorum TaxID=248454 RepID=A0A8S9X8K3_APOLU|nr:hypothetical protein GE061_018811 [Apolygus lucorum]
MDEDFTRFPRRQDENDDDVRRTINRIQGKYDEQTSSFQKCTNEYVNHKDDIYGVSVIQGVILCRVLVILSYADGSS